MPKNQILFLVVTRSLGGDLETVKFIFTVSLNQGQ